MSITTALDPRRARPRTVQPDDFARLHPLVVAALALAAMSTAPWLWSLPAATLAIGASALVLLGVPHGALDHRVARPMLVGLGPAWFGAFAVLYLGTAALVLGGWLVAPGASLAAFLAVSAWHFGVEDAEGRGPVARVARGASPIALPLLFHPERTGRFFETLSGGELTSGPLLALAWLWVPAAALHAARVLRAGRWEEAAEMGAVAAVFAALPPLAGFAFYFLVVHSPRHMAELARRRDPARPGRGWRWALARSLPLTVATFVLGGLVLLGLEGTLEERFVRSVYWGLAALTVPHVILHHLDCRWGAQRLG